MAQERAAVIRVGFIFDDSWLGGINYFRNLLAALYGLPERKIEAVVFTGLRSSEKHFDGLPEIKIVRSRLFDQGSIFWRIRHIVRYRLNRDFLFESLLKKHRVSVLSHSDWLPGNVSVPTIGWIPDFQHVHFSDFFSADEVAARNRHFSDMCRLCSTIIVSSFDALADLERFDSKCAAKSAVLQFVVGANKDPTLLPSRDELEARHHFVGKYFLLPNQFWKHKNHKVVIEALGLLRLTGQSVRVLATGSAEDYRHPEFFNSLMARARELDVLDEFQHLGLVHTSDLAGLMHHALAIINPSLFEGWSTTVEEAKSLGKQIILSDIPVHREQHPPRANYFPPDDANALAAILWEVWNKKGSNELHFIESARRSSHAHRLEFARQYQRIVLEAVEGH